MKSKAKINIVTMVTVVGIMLSQAHPVAALENEDKCETLPPIRENSGKIVLDVSCENDETINSKYEEELLTLVKRASSQEVLSANGNTVSIDIPEGVGSVEELLKVKELKELVEAAVEEAADEIEELEESEEDNLLPIEEVAQLVLDGKFGSGANRKLNLEDEGYNYEEVQALVDTLAPKARVVEAPKVATASRSTGNTIKAYPHNTFKSYMRWTALSSSSPQGRLAAQSVKDPSTAIMVHEGRYLVALGFAYASRIGQHIDMVMENGQIIPVIVGDWKARAHTDQWNSASKGNGDIVEFIVSSNADANRAVSGSGSYNTIFPGKVKEFRILN